MSPQSDIARLLGLRGDLRVGTVESEALRGNALGDPAERPVVAYLPPGYDAEASQRYAVLYVLHGYSGSAAGAIAGRAWETNVVQWADRLIGSGAMRPAIVVVVDGFTRLGGSQYLDSIHNGNYGTYTVRDVVAHVDASYRTIPREGGRAVLGKSSGGFGALHLVLEHPGEFGAFASHSGDAYFRHCYPISFPTAHRVLEKHSFNTKAFVESFEAKQKRSQDEFETMALLAGAAAYSPKSAAAFDVELPFDHATGALREDVFARWEAFDPVHRVSCAAEELKRLRLRYVDCGRCDEYGLDIGARLVVAAIRAHGLDVRHEEFDDDHRNVGYRYATSLPALAAALDNE